jgi:hypothetical protein
MSKKLERLEREAEALQRHQENERTAEQKEKKEAASRETKAQQKKHAQARRAPTEFWYQFHVKIVLGLFMMLMMFWGLGAMKASFQIPLEVVAGLSALAGMVLAVSAVNHVVWRKRLKFDLIGYDEIKGKGNNADNYVSWIRFTIRVTLTEEDETVKRYVATALQMLAARAESDAKSDSDAKWSPEKAWQVADPLTATGEGTVTLYTVGVLRKWLRREMNTVARETGKVKSVTVKATYTGSSYYVTPSTD